MNVRAYAKINIGLRVLEKRPDGYHNIETVFHQIDLYDELVFAPADVITLTTTSSEIPTDSNNLCVRAAETLQRYTRTKKGVAIALKKNIPVGAGLGGGSSDAASVLVVLNRLWKTGLVQEELSSLAATLGSDVPFFVRGGTAVGTSRGELLDYFRLEFPFVIVTVTPPIHISTAWAYSHVKPRATNPTESLRSIVERGLMNPSGMAAAISNDFEESVFEAHPQIRRMKDTLMSSGALFALMSGSGSSVFGLFRDIDSARTATGRFVPPATVSLTPPNFQPIAHE